MTKLIHVVGTSASGKTSAQKTLAERIGSLGCEVQQIVEPGPLRDLAKAYRRREDKNPLTELAIFTADRLITYNDQVFPNRGRDNLVLLFDRGLPDTVVYQGILSGVDINLILRMNSFVPHSDLYLVLTVDGRIGHDRAKRRLAETGEPITQSETPEEIDRRAAAYRTLPKYFPNVHIIDTSQMDITQTTTKCFELVKGIL